jgi:myo-inositol-1(or 4)-monophosphatase
MTAPAPVAELVDVAEAAARAAGEVLARFAARRQAGGDLGLRDKGSARDLVTDADVAAQAAVAEVLAARRPGDGILGEEQAEQPGSSGLRWLVDPLDGTTNFVYGRPDWCVSVACEAVHEPGRPLAGAVFEPTRGQLWLAGLGLGAWRDGTRLGPLGPSPLAEALVATGFHYDLALRRREAAMVAELLPRVRDLRRNGSAALELAGVAAGQADAFVEAGVHPWDWAAGGLLVTEAGGRATMTDLDPMGLLVAANPALHDELLELLAGLAA